MYCIHKVFLDVRTAIDARSKTGSMLHPEIHGGTTLDENSFRSALRYIRPKADELTWQAIPWQTDVFVALGHERRPAGMYLKQRLDWP